MSVRGCPRLSADTSGVNDGLASVSVVTLNHRTADRIARASGFVLARNNGGHNVYRHPDGRVLVLPDPTRKHEGHPAAVRKYLRQAGIEVKHD